MDDLVRILQLAGLNEAAIGSLFNKGGRGMVKHNDEEWTLPRRKPITKEALDRAIRAEEDAAAQELLCVLKKDGVVYIDGEVKPLKPVKPKFD